jgi:branched-chain amino acid transport system permease protein
MMTFFYTYKPLLDLVLFNTLLAFSQYVALRAGVFSMGTAAFAALGAYAGALLTTKLEVHPLIGIVVALAIGAAAGALVAVPLARLRGVFQALATIALVQLILSGTTNWVSLTNGALGVNSIPNFVGTLGLLVTAAVVIYFMAVIGHSSIGRAWDVIREDETVAVALGISVRKHHMIAFILSGTIGALAGAMHAYNSYSITPNEYGFGMVVAVLAMVVLGGRVSIWGPPVGALILTVLPELFRAFAEYRAAVQGAMLMVSIIFLPRGVADTIITKFRAYRLKHAGRQKVKVVTL